MLRVFLGTYPLVLAWGVWVTTKTFEAKSFEIRASDKYLTRVESVAAQKELDARFALLPPKDWRDQILRMADDIRSLNRIVQENQVALAKLQLTIDQIAIKKP